MNFKKNFFLFLILNILVTFPIRADFRLEVEDDDGLQDLNEFVIEEIEIPEDAGSRAIIPIFAQYALQNTPDIPTPEELLSTLYKRTNPIRRRSILDSELFKHDLYYPTAPFTITPFASFTHKGCFVENSTTIGSYLDLFQGDVPEKIQDLIIAIMGQGNPGIDAQTVALFSTLNIPDVLELFTAMKVQEKQFGAMLRYIYDIDDNWKIDIRAPLLWQLYHFYLTPSEEAEILDQPIIKSFGPGDFMPFARAHLISDKIGLGDTQINFERVFYERSTSSCSVGLSIGIPTAFALKKGVYGSYFDKRKDRPDFNLVRDIVKFIENGVDDIDKVKANGSNLGLAVLDRLSSVLLDHPLGRDGHWTLGAYYRSTLDFTPQLRLLSHAGFICPLPGKEDRSIKKIITRADIDALQALPIGTEEEAIFALNAYNDLLLDKLFPQNHRCTIFPGIIFMSNSCLTYTKDKWVFSLGTDMWWQTKEELLSKVPSNLDTSCILNDYGYQTSTYIRFQYHNPESAWIYSFMGGTTGLTDRISEATTLSFNIQRHF